MEENETADIFNIMSASHCGVRFRASAAVEISDAGDNLIGTGCATRIGTHNE